VPADTQLEGFPYRKMAEPHSCGPTALAQALEFCELGRPVEELERTWGFRRGSDRTDTPGHHLRVLRRLGIPFAIRQGLTFEMVASALEAGHPVVGLLATGRLVRHWVVITGITERDVTLAWGDSDRPRKLPRRDFESAFGGGALDVLMGTRRLGYCVGGDLPWGRSRALELYFRLQRPLAQYCVVPVIETFLAGLRGGRGAGHS